MKTAKLSFYKSLSVLLVISFVLSVFFSAGQCLITRAEEGLELGSKNYIANGDFSDGLNGFMINGNVKAVSSPENGDSVTLDGKAAYIPQGVDSNVLVIPVTLVSGKYVWSYETSAVGNAGWCSVGFGICTTNTNNPWHSGSSALALKSDVGSIDSYKTDRNDPWTNEGNKFYYLNYGEKTPLNGKRTVTVNFTVKSNTTLYLWIAGHTAVQYVDNMQLCSYETLQTDIVNGDFEKGDLSGFTATVSKNNAIKVVNEKQNADDNITLDGRAAYLDSVDGSALQAKVKLQKGKYKWCFDLYANKISSGWGAMFGITTGLADGGLAFGSGTAIEATAADVGASPIAPKTFNKQGFYFEYGNGHWNHKLEVSFELKEDTTVYFYVNSTPTCRIYVDNMLLKTVDETQTSIINGDFETGDLTGFSATVNKNNAIRVVEEKQNESDSLNLDGKALYMTNESGVALQTKVKLPAGKYVWEFDIWAPKASSWNPVFGITTALASNGLCYGSNKQIDISSVTDIKSSKPIASTGSNGYYFDVGTQLCDSHIKMYFELEEEKILYFFIHSNGGTYAYIDNMSVTDASKPGGDFTPEKWLNNGDFETGDFTGYNKNFGEDMKIVEEKQDESHNVTLSGKALYMPKTDNVNALQTGIKLPAGSYTWSFDAYVIKTASGWNNFFGVATEIGDSGVAMHSGTLISTATAFNNSVNSVLGDIDTAGKNYHYFKYGNGQWNTTATVKFTLYKEQIVYFFINSSSVSSAYIDNMELIKDDGYTDDFNSGILSENFIVAAKGNKSALKNNRIEYPVLNDADRNTSFIYKASELSDGKYQWSFDIGGTAAADITNKALAEFGVYSKINTEYNICDDGMLNISASSDAGKTVQGAASVNLNVEKLNVNENITARVTVTFTVDKNTADTLYLATYIPNTMFTNVWLDNWALVKIASVENGDFELGDLTGFLNNGADWSNVRVVSAAEAKAAGANINGNYAGYIPAGSAGKETASFLTHSIKLNEGKYTLKFDVDIASKASVSKFWYDVYGSLANNGQYAKGTRSAVSTHSKAFDVNNTEKATGYISKTHDRWLVSSAANGIAHYTVYVMLEVTFDRTVYFTAGFDSESTGSSAYIDNIDITEGWLYAEPTKATYADKNIVFEIGFESEFEQPITGLDGASEDYANMHYEKTSEQAHTGNYSVRFDPAHKDGWQYLFFTDSNGYPIRSYNLEPGAIYELSWWVYSSGPTALNAMTGYQTAGGSIQQLNVNDGWKWLKYSYRFIAPENADITNQIVRIVSTFAGVNHKGTSLYYDDIRLVKLDTSVLSYDENNGKYCENFFNILENGNFENALGGTIWENTGFNITRIENIDKADTGRAYAHISGSGEITVKLRVWKGYVYYFGYSYRGNRSSNLKIGILNNEGKELPASPYGDTTQTGLLSPTSFDGDWHRDGISFLSSPDGWIYFRLSGANVDIDLDNISIFRARTAYDDDPETYGIVTVSDENNIDIPVIPDEVEIPDFDDTDLIPDENETDNSSTVNVKKPKKSAVKPDTDNSILIISLVIAGAVLAAAAVTVIVIIKKKRSSVK